VGRLVATAERGGIGLAELDDDAVRAALADAGDTTAAGLVIDQALPGRLREAATIDAALASCDVVGGTAPGRVAAALAEARDRLGAQGV
jgi:hypothetical protein